MSRHQRLGISASSAMPPGSFLSDPSWQKFLLRYHITVAVAVAVSVEAVEPSELRLRDTKRS